MYFTHSLGAVSEPIKTGLNKEEHLKILAKKFEKLNKDLESNPSEKNHGVFNNLLGNLMQIFNTPVTEKPKQDNSSIESLGRESPPDLENDLYPPEFGTCEQPGKVIVFAGAGCYSNITVNFYYMDSRKYWNYALAFGVEHDTLPQVALVLVDSQVRVCRFRYFQS